MTETSNYTASELLAVMSARLLLDGQIIFAGVGIPLFAATLAQRVHAPSLTILFEGGVIGPFIVPGELPPSLTSSVCTRKANMVLPITDVMLLLNAGISIGFMGGAQIDRYGNLNSSFIGDPEQPKIRFPGTGGGNDISSLTNMIVAMKQRNDVLCPGRLYHQPGFPRWRHIAGGCWPCLWRHVPVVTDLAIMGFDEQAKK
ncbi:MAG: hypothetical protein CM1200mP41_32650 [Gammaproteobacteria bacterium]|nr:MAG: hypothetical protein CM1200mP41_32650 [Gammaproteobacteria bacterium]